jgi:ribosome recycling factor
MSISELLNQADEAFSKAFDHLKLELGGLQIGRASAALVEGVQVEVYGARQPLKNLAQVSVPDAKTLFIQPWDRASLQSIEKAIRESPLGLNPNNDGTRIILNIPPLTEERRRDLTKLVGQLAEEARIALRRSRQDVLGKAKRAAEEGGDFTEDDEKVFEKKLQEKVDDFNKKIEELAEYKEVEVMKV